MQKVLGYGAFVALLLMLADTASSQELAMTVETRHVFGRFQEGDHVASFDSRRADDGLFDVKVELEGIVLTAMIDRANGVSVLDGYFSDDATDAYMSSTDRDVLRRFNEELSGRLTTLDDSGQYLQHAVSVWSEYPATFPLTRTVDDSSIQSLCDQLGKPVPATHDDNRHNAGDDASTLDEAIVSPPSLGSCANADKTWFLDGGWKCFEADHDIRIEQAKGNCFANCGSDCSGGGLQMTQDCHNHDQCVRTGHDLASLWCNDEFSSAIDDEFNAPNCAAPPVPNEDEHARLPTKPSYRLMALETVRHQFLSRANQSGPGQLYNIPQRRRESVIGTIEQRMAELGEEPPQRPLVTERQRVQARAQQIAGQVQQLEAKLQGLRLQPDSQRNKSRIAEIIQELRQAQQEALQ